jgi:hypothetical protein
MNCTRMNCIRDAMFGIAVGCAALTPLCASAGDNPCPRPAAGSIVAPPPTLSSENGALDLAFDYFTTTDSANRTLFCFVTPVGLESPTLRIKPGETLSIAVRNRNPPAPAGSPTEVVSNASDRCGDSTMTIKCTLPWYEYDAHLPWRPGDPYDHQFWRDLQLQSAFPGERDARALLVPPACPQIASNCLQFNFVGLHWYCVSDRKDARHRSGSCLGGGDHPCATDARCV